MSSRAPALGFIFVTLVIDILGIGLIVPILPELVVELHGEGAAGSSMVYGTLLALYALMQFFFAPVLGTLSDAVGRRPVILVALFGAGLDYFLLALAPSLWLFVIGRIVAGITGANYAAATAYIADVSPPEKRAANFGLVGAAFGLGFVIGPALGGWLGGEFGTRVPFYVAGFLTLANWLYGVFVLPESLAEQNRRPFSWGNANPFRALGVLWQRGSLVLGLATAMFIASVAHQVYPATWALYTKFRYAWTPKDVGLSLALVGIMAVIVQGILIRKLMPKLGEKRATVFGLAITGVAFVLYGIAPSGVWIYAIIVAGAIGGLATPAMQGMISRSVGDDEQGGIQGALTSLNSVAGVIGPLIATGLFFKFAGKTTAPFVPGAPFFAGAALTLIAVIVAFQAFEKDDA